MGTLTLTNHQDKIRFLSDYLRGSLEEYDLYYPLMIVGQGGSGKTKVVDEVCSNSPLPVCSLVQGDKHFYPGNSEQPIPRCALILQEVGTDKDLEFARYLNARIVRFEPDLNFTANLSDRIH